MKNYRIAFFILLAINLFFVAMIAVGGWRAYERWGHMGGGGWDRPTMGRDWQGGGWGMMGGPRGRFFEDFSEADRRVARELFDENRPALRAAREQMRDARDAVRDAMEAEPFDAAKLSEAFAQLGAARDAMTQIHQGMMIQMMERLSPQAREELIDHGAWGMGMGRW